MEKINFIDVGCDNNKGSCLVRPWNNNIKYINFLLGFDPLLTDFYRRKIKEIGIRHKLFKKGVFKSNCKRKLYKLNKRDSSSFYLPNFDIINKNKPKNKKNRYTVRSTKNIECVRIDTVIKTMKINFDFVKIDVQGDEYNVIRSIGKYLDIQIVGIYVEVSHIDFYKNINLKEDVHKLLNKHGFYMHKKVSGKDYICGDYLYIRDDKKKIKKIELIKKIYED